jgi:branched-chain amino acid transport system permease protein
MDQRSIQWLCFVLAGTFAGISGALYAYLKGSVFPDALAIPTSIDGLVMVLLGGIHTVAGPIAGAAVYKFLSIYVMSQMDYWKLILGGLIVVLGRGLPARARRVLPAQHRAPPRARRRGRRGGGGSRG